MLVLSMSCHTQSTSVPPTSNVQKPTFYVLTVPLRGFQSRHRHPAPYASKVHTPWSRVSFGSSGWPRSVASKKEARFGGEIDAMIWPMEQNEPLGPCPTTSKDK